MRTIGIATYSLRVRAKRSNEYEQLGSIEGRQSLADLFDGYLRSITDAETVDVAAQAVLKAARRERDVELLWGLFNSGDYGYAAEGLNIRSKQLSYRRTPDDAEIIPFYYRAFLPRMSDLGLLLLQRYGHFGVFTSVSRGFRAFLDHHLPDHILEINRLVPAEVVRQLTDGEIRAIQVIAHTIPDDLADKLRFLGNRQEIGTFIIEAKAKRNSFLAPPAWLRRIREGRADVIELPTELSASDAVIRIRVNYEGTTRTIDLSDPANIAPYINATRDLEVDSTGHPTFTSIDAYCQRLLNDLLVQLGRR